MARLLLLLGLPALAAALKARRTGPGAAELAELEDLERRAALLEAAKLKAAEQEDFDLAKELKQELGVLLADSGAERLQRLKSVAAEAEDFELARELKARAAALENGTLANSSAELQAYYSAAHEPLPWGWRSAKDPSSGMLYYWPVNDRSSVTWDRPLVALPGAPVPPKPLLFEVRSIQSGKWSLCDVVGNGTKPGSYNISIKMGASGWQNLSNVPGFILRNITSNQTLMTNEEYMALQRAAAWRPKLGEALEVRTKSNSWLPCVVTSSGNETDTYNVHVPLAPPGHQDHTNIPLARLRQHLVGNATAAK